MPGSMYLDAIGELLKLLDKQRNASIVVLEMPKQSEHRLFAFYTCAHSRLRCTNLVLTKQLL